MLQFLSGRLSLPMRVLLVSACAAPPVALLIFLFVNQAAREDRFTAQELRGAAYIARVWPTILSGDLASLPLKGPGPIKGAEAFRAQREAQAFAATDPGGRAARGAVLLQAVADGSNLTLDTDLDSFYAMDAATVALPRLLAALTPVAGARENALALGRAQAEEAAALRDLQEAGARDPDGVARAAMAGRASRLSAAFDAFAANPREPALRAALMAEMDRSWRAGDAELTRLLQARLERLHARLIASLSLVALALAAAAALAVGMTRGLTRRLKVLLGVMDRLNAGDTGVDIPYLSDRNETGRIATTLEAFRRGLIEAGAAAAAVRESEERYRMLADNATDLIIQYDADFRLLYISPSVRLFGYSPEEILAAADPAGFVHPEELEAIQARRSDGLNGRETRPLDARLRQANGEWLWFESTMTPIHDDRGALKGFISAFRHIHQRKLAEQALIESEARYRLLTENMSDVLLRYDVDQHIAYVSPSVRQWGYTPEDFVGQRAGVFVHPEDQERVASRRDAMLRGDPVRPVEARIRRADGSWTWIESNPAPVRDEAGAVIGAVLVLRDINARKETEAALTDSEARYRMLADNTSDIIQKFNAEGVVEYISPSVRQLGYEPEFFIGRPTALLVDNEDREEVLRRREDLLAGRPVSALESRVRAADGRLVWLESRPSPILDDDGKLVGVVNVMRDVSARKAGQTAMQELSLELRRVARASALGAFTASLAHEVNQPLAAAAMSGEAALRWLSAEPINFERGLKAVRRTVEDARRAAEVVRRMRSLVTKEEPKATNFDAREAIREVLALTERERERFGVRTITNLGTGPAVTRGDRVQFQQVMINLILNALEAMADTPEDERVLVVRAEEDGEALGFVVEDRGPGVDPDKRDEIFESLFTTKLGGTGLGLSIARSILESHGGRIWVEQAEPRGAAFKLRIPALAKMTAPA
jgi:PAS domain S-box-containing protein